VPGQLPEFQKLVVLAPAPRFTVPRSIVPGVCPARYRRESGTRGPDV
jgi:hypothetical protein